MDFRDNRGLAVTPRANLPGLSNAGAPPTPVLRPIEPPQSTASAKASTGRRADAIRAWAGNSLVFDLCKARAVYDELDAAQRVLLPQRLLQ